MRSRNVSCFHRLLAKPGINNITLCLSRQKKVDLLHLCESNKDRDQVPQKTNIIIISRNNINTSKGEKVVMTNEMVTGGKCVNLSIQSLN